MRSRFQFVDDHRNTYEVKRLCQVLDVNRSSTSGDVAGGTDGDARNRPRLSHSRGWRQGAECSGRVRTQLDSAPSRVRGRSRRPASAGVRVRFRGPDDSSTQPAHIPLTKPYVDHPAVRRGPPLSAVQAAGHERTMVVSKVLRARLRLDSFSTGRITGPPALVPHGSGSTRGRRTNRPGRNWPERRLTVGNSRGGSPHRAVGLVMPCRGQPYRGQP